jgi:hypothetical protein
MKKLILLLFIAITYSCSSDTELSDSVYNPDIEYPGLPAYSEAGYNNFGANYDRSTFTYSQYEMPLKVTAANNELSFIFQGINGNDHYNDLTLRFILPVSNIDIYQDLLAYNDSIIDLSADDIKVEMISYGNSKMIDVLEGELYFKRSQKVYLDDAEYGIILSGLFNFKYVVNNIPSTMSDGRFDCGVNNGNFYNLK